MRERATANPRAQAAWDSAQIETHAAPASPGRRQQRTAASCETCEQLAWLSNEGGVAFPPTRGHEAARSANACRVAKLVSADVTTKSKKHDSRRTAPHPVAPMPAVDLAVCFAKRAPLSSTNKYHGSVPGHVHAHCVAQEGRAGAPAASIRWGGPDDPFTRQHGHPAARQPRRHGALG